MFFYLFFDIIDTVRDTHESMCMLKVKSGSVHINADKHWHHIDKTTSSLLTLQVPEAEIKYSRI